MRNYLARLGWSHGDDEIFSTEQMIEWFDLGGIGRSPARFYAELRLQRARLLLEQTSMSVTDVGVACGFVSASHFSRSYREHYGKSPRQSRITASPQGSA